MCAVGGREPGRPGPGRGASVTSPPFPGGPARPFLGNSFALSDYSAGGARRALSFSLVPSRAPGSLLPPNLVTPLPAPLVG